MLPPPPTSTLFPYTTLFRSPLARPRARLRRAGRAPAGRARSPDRGTARKQPTRGSRLQVDRKSTRLNSSHVEISYAVFCLKKKKNIKIVHSITRIHIDVNVQ